jgi:formylglycine-generating enzyme required for sulfatase activity
MLFALGSRGRAAEPLPKDKTHTNAIGMKLARIEPGTFLMGADQTPLPKELSEDRPHRRNGDFDEHPAHKVTLSQPFYMGIFEVTNAQYEQFDPEHRKLRGKLGFAKEDDEAVVFVSWHDAVRFCEWLSKKEDRPYRLPTEAEWEYACRAGTTTPFHTGETLPKAFHKNVKESWYPARYGKEAEEVVPLTVGKTPPNAWGLYDMHGNVEEWCHDWYGPYEKGEQTDPVGRADGLFRVTRGGSHSTLLYYLRSANRLGNVPEDRHWLIGFRVVLGELPKTKPLPAPSPPPWAREVKQEVPADLAKGPDPKVPYFNGPRPYVKIPKDANGPLFAAHNHDPAITDCPNGDLLAIWYSCVSERGRELTVVASRLRYGQEEWEPTAPFWTPPDRNAHAPMLWFDGKDTLYHINGHSVAATWGPLAVVLRTSKDSGATWSRPRLIIPEHGPRRQPVESVIRLRDGSILFACDAVPGGSGGTAVWISRDDGKTWTDPGAEAPAPKFAAGQKGGWIAGIHAPVVELKDGRLLAFGRGDTIDGRMPKSISSDGGKTWTYSAGPFPPVSGGQRCVLLRLKEGPLFFAGFTGPRQNPTPLTITDAKGNKREVKGLFSALSFDEGETWTNLRLISDDGPGRDVETMDGRPFTLSKSSGEPGGYLSVCQAPNSVIHLISSRQHYAFNLAWLKAPPPAEK